MSMRPTDLNIAGAVDLSSLRPPAPAAPTSETPASGDAVMTVTEADFERLVLQRSMTLPVLVDFWASWCGPCKQLSPLLERFATEAEGAWVLAKVDVDANQALAGQLQIQSIPTVLIALGGRLLQGFTGALPERDLRAFVAQVLAAAGQAGLPGTAADAAVGEPPVPAEPELVAAEDSLAQGDYAAAVASYDALLTRRPGDAEAISGRAFAALLQRSDGADPETVLARAAAAPDDVTAQTAAADVEVLSERIDEAVARLVALVRRTSDNERDEARMHLLGLLDALDPADPRVAAGRRALSNALF